MWGRICRQRPKKLLCLWRKRTVGGCWSMVWRCMILLTNSAIKINRRKFSQDCLCVARCSFISPSLCSHYLYTEINCGSPKILPNTNLLWDHTSRRGSVALYECEDGFYQQSGNNFSKCSLSGEWGEVSIKCKGRVILLINLRECHCLHCFSLHDHSCVSLTLHVLLWSGMLDLEFVAT